MTHSGGQRARPKGARPGVSAREEGPVAVPSRVWADDLVSKDIPAGHSTWHSHSAEPRSDEVLSRDCVGLYPWLQTSIWVRLALGVITGKMKLGLDIRR